MAYTDIDDPSAYFHTQLYTGNATARSITNDANAGDFKPDWVWIKVRNNANNHRLFDSSRGATKDLISNSNSAESTDATRLTSFNTNGFSIGTNAEVNSNTHNIVAWQWKANGGTTTTNDASATGIGTIDSVYQANTTAGFSIVTYTGTTSAGSIAHGLGAVPKMIIVKNIQDGAENWAVQSPTASDPWTDYMWLDLPNALDDNAGLWNDTAPTSTVFTIGTSGVVSQAENHVAYCFAEKQGYSKIGKYIGNGNANGTFVYTGFKPAYVMVKRTNGVGSWVIHDSTRAGFSNPTDEYVYANATNVEATDIPHDFLSNGFKIRATWDDTNGSGSTYIYMAFADSPFVSSKGVPTTAR